MRVLDIKIKELLNGDIDYIAIDVRDINRLKHIIDIISNYAKHQFGVFYPLYLKYMRENNQYLRVDKCNNDICFNTESKNKLEPWKLIKDTDILKNIKTENPKLIHDAEYCNSNLDDMLGNFFDAIRGQSTKEPMMNNIKRKQMKKDVLKVFDKGQVDVKQIIVQMYLKDLTSNVPFVNELVRKELARIKNEIVENFTPIHNLDTYNLKFLASVDYLEDIKNCDSVVDLECAYIFYVYEKEIAKELRLLGKPDYSWIKDFIIQKNVMSQKRVDLFKSKKFEIFIEGGSIHLVDVKPNIRYSLDIKYNEEEKTFHL